MKDFETIVISIIGIVTSMFFLLFGLCAFVGGPRGMDAVLGVVFLALGIAILVVVVRRLRHRAE